jgi:preprotein translocase subunit SecF
MDDPTRDTNVDAELDGERPDMTQDRTTDFLQQPFWRVMAFVMTALIAVSGWLLKSNIEKLDKVSDSQIDTKALVKFMAEQNARNQEEVKEVRSGLDQVKLNDRTQDARLDALDGRRSK